MNRSDMQTWLEDRREPMMQDIMTLVRIRSVSESGEGTYPYGEGCAKVLDKALGMAETMGFEVENHDYHCGSVLLRGDTDEELGIFAHLDVVHEGGGWRHPPYEPYCEGGWIYGRGSADNKGAAVTALYAMAYLKEKGWRLRHTVRLFLGCNEECGMKDIEYFTARYPAPAFSFTPDSRFSVCYAEKGRLHMESSAPLAGNLKQFTAGVSVNAVPAFAEALLSGVTLEEAEHAVRDYEHIFCEASGTDVRFTATGISAHSAFPEQGDSASVKLAAFLRRMPFVSEEAKEVLRFPAEAFADFYGKAAGIACEDDVSGRLTMVGGTLRTEEGRLIQDIDIRYPVRIYEQQLQERFFALTGEYGWQAEVRQSSPPAFVNPESTVVKELARISAEVLGEDYPVYSMGGGTYARKLPNAVAFGPGILGLKRPCPDGHGGAHQPDECVSLDVLMNAAEIYILALDTLDRIVNGAQQN